jgi:hypothetical protein
MSAEPETDTSTQTDQPVKIDPAKWGNVGTGPPREKASLPDGEEPRKSWETDDWYVYDADTQELYGSFLSSRHAEQWANNMKPEDGDGNLHVLKAKKP